MSHSDELTEDHVFPRSWYPDTTPSDVEKWTVPACLKCNNFYSRIEREILVRLGICLNSETKESKGIREKALRAIDPKQAKGRRDRIARAAMRDQIRRDIIKPKNGRISGILPNFGMQEGIDYGDSPAAIQVSAEQLEELGRKLVRGLTFKLQNDMVITSDFKIEIYHAENEKVQDVIDLIKRTGFTEYRGPGVEVQRSVLKDNGVVSLFRITTWGRWTVYAVVLPVTDSLNL